MIGQRELCVENYKCIRYYTDSCIVLLTKNGKLKLEGDRLSIQSYDNEEIRINTYFRKIKNYIANELDM